jgi:hypothetical protein
MTTTAPAWLEALSQAYVLAGVACAVLIGVDVLRRPQKMAVMNWVWPITGLWAGPLGLFVYLWLGRAPPPGAEQDDKTPKPFWRSTLVGALHCSAGCTLGDLCAEWIVFAAGLTLFGSKLGGAYALDFALAYAFGIAFQYFSIAPMRGLGPRDGLVAAVKADTLSLTAYEVGMFAWMALAKLVLFPGLDASRWLFWFMMQIAMLVGLATTLPVNAWLIRAGWKEAM